SAIFFLHVPAHTAIYPLSLHDALPIYFLARLEIGDALRRHVDRITGARVAADPGVAQARRKRAEAAQFDPSPFSQARCDFVEEDVDHLLDFFRPKVGVFGGQRLQEFGSDHRLSYPSGVPLGPASFTMPSR